MKDVNLNEKEIIKMIEQNPTRIAEIENPTEDMKKAALKGNGMMIKFMKKPSVELQRLAVKSDPLSIEHIDNLDEEVAISSVRALWNSLKYIKNPNEKIIEEAVKSKGWAIQYVENPSEELKLLAVNKDYDAIKYIKNPSEEVQEAAVLNYWGAIRFIEKPTLKVKRLSVIKDEEAINYIAGYSYDEMKLFIEDNINVVKYLYESIDPELVVDVLIEKLDKGEMTREYMKNFLDLEILEMDKVSFIREYGDKETKKLLVDCKL